jgi:hypothetical protein
MSDNINFDVGEASENNEPTTGEASGNTASVNTGVNTSGVNTQKTKTSEEEFIEFVPSDFRNKTWVKKYKNRDEFFRGFEQMQNVMGKQSSLPDIDKLSDEELRNFYSKTAPKDVKDYGFEFDDKAGILETMKENGVSKKQAKAIMDKYFKYAEETYNSSMDRKYLEKELREVYGDETKSKVERFKNVVSKYGKEHVNVFKNLSNEQYKAVINTVDNIFNDFDLSSDSPVFKGEGIFRAGNSKENYNKLLDEYYSKETPEEKKTILREKIMNYKFN